MGQFRSEADRRRSVKRRKHIRAYKSEKSRLWSKVHRRGQIENPHERVSTEEILNATEEE